MSKQYLTALHITDFHLFADKTRCLASVNTYNTLKCVLEDIIDHRQHIYPDVIFVTGDISQDYSEASYRIAYQELREVFGEQMPIFATCGNHEEPTRFKQYFGTASSILDQIDEFDSWRFIILNSQLPGSVPGMLSEENIALLEEGLMDCNKPTAILMHHHILPVGCRWLDNINLLNYRQTLEIIQHAPQVKLVISGHVHQATCSCSEGTVYLTTPSTSWQFSINHDDFKLGSSMPGYRWIRFTKHGRFTSTTQRVKHNPNFIPDQIAGY